MLKRIKSQLPTALSVTIAVALLLLLFFGEVLVGGGVYYPGDIARIYLPQRNVLAASLDKGVLPWWSSEVGLGYPLLAEGETGALYPPNWLIYGLLPTDWALNVSIIMHVLLSALGMYLHLKTLGLRRAAAVLGAVAWSMGGYMVAHLSHVSILTVTAWMPWLFCLTERLLWTERKPWAAMAWLSLLTGLQYLGGHPQASVLAVLPVGLRVLCHLFRRPTVANEIFTSGLRRPLIWLAAMVAGLLIGLPQLWPSAELGALSQRSGGLDATFFTSYSFHPGLISTLVSPFVLGNPYPHGSVEMMGYVGLLPLGLASVALWRSRHRQRWFYLGLAVLGTLMALGRWNPLYDYLRFVPVLKLFRVPARYLCWVSYGIAVLAAMGLDTLLSQEWRARSGGWWLGATCTVLLGLVGIAVQSASDTDAMVQIWQWLPLVLGVLLVLTLLAIGRLPRAYGLGLVFAVLLIDLWAYGAVLDSTYNGVWPREDVSNAPAIAEMFESDNEIYRVFVKDEILPALAVQRASLYPNMALGQGVQCANVYLPLVPSSLSEYLSDAGPDQLDRMNVKYYLIPQLLPVDQERELYDVENPYAALPVGSWQTIIPHQVARVTLESYLSHSAALADGELVGRILLRDDAGNESALPIRVGIESAEWAYDRSDVLAQIAHAKPAIATTFPARSGFPPEDHPGHTYQAVYALSQPLEVSQVQIELMRPEAFVRVERVRLYDAQGNETLLSHALGLGDYSIVYRSEDVLAYRNEDAWPRAYLAPASSFRQGETGLVWSAQFDRDALQPAEIVSYSDLQVVVRVVAEAPSYLVLADQYYPGWQAHVDGGLADIVPLESVFRAVAVEEGQHVVDFEYVPYGLGNWLGKK